MPLARSLFIAGVLACLPILLAPLVTGGSVQSNSPGTPQPDQAAGLMCTLSASSSSSTATFSGTISGYPAQTSPSWTLDFGDSATTSGSGTPLFATHAYDAPGTYFPSLSAYDVTGAMTTCSSNAVVVVRQLSVNVQETLNVIETAGVVPPLAVNDAVKVADQPKGGPVPLGVNDSAKVNEVPTLSAGSSNNPFGSLPGGILGVIAIGGVAVAGGLAVLWKFVLSRHAAGR